MSEQCQVRSYDYVNHPYEQVRQALTSGAEEWFAAATRSAATRAESVASALKVNVAGIDIGTDVAIKVTNITGRDADTGSSPSTCLSLEWGAVRSPRLFPLMHGELAIYPITAEETQLDFSGHYQPPLGVVGHAINSVVGHRIAEASVHRFIGEVAEHLRRTL